MANNDDEILETGLVITGLLIGIYKIIYDTIAESRQNKIKIVGDELKMELKNIPFKIIKEIYKGTKIIEAKIKSLSSKREDVCDKISGILGINKSLYTYLDSVDDEYKSYIHEIFDKNEQTLKYLFEYYDKINSLYMKYFYIKREKVVNLLAVYCSIDINNFIKNITNDIEDEIDEVKKRLAGYDIKYIELDSVKESINQKISELKQELLHKEINRTVGEMRETMKGISPISDDDYINKKSFKSLFVKNKTAQPDELNDFMTEYKELLYEYDKFSSEIEINKEIKTS